MTANYDDVVPVAVHLVKDGTKEKRPVELRVTHRTVILTQSSPYVQVAGYDPARKELHIEVIDYPVIVAGSSGQASDLGNLTLATVYYPNPVTNQIPLGATGVATYNNNSFPVGLTISGGTVTAIAVNGINTGQTSGFFQIPANGSVTITYTVAPTTFFTGGIPYSSINTPNGRLLTVNVGEYVIPGPNETWFAGAQYPNRVGVTIVREI